MKSRKPERSRGKDCTEAAAVEMKRWGKFNSYPGYGAQWVTSLSLGFLCSRMVMAHPTLQSQDLAHCLKHSDCSVIVSKLES